MFRRASWFTLLLAALHGLLLLGASKRPHVVVLLSQDLPPYRQTIEGFQQQLDKLGIGCELEILPLAAPLERVQADLLLALGTPATKRAGGYTGAPVVSALALRAADLGPRGGMTGVFLEFPVEVELQWMTRLLPGHRRVGVIYSRAENQERMLQATRAAEALSLQLIRRPIEGPREIPASLASLQNEAEVLWGVADDTVLTPQTATEFLTYALRNRMPFVGLSLPWVKAGALYALDRDYADVGRQCGEMAARILRGEPVAAVPREAPRRVVYSVNLRTAEQLALSIPGSLLRGASEVIE
ncbi:MAG TPA: ABC transporter substrate binding protein [Candidatus Polarisedimenticolaceae bacterium]|nr:ABC transporter substrate binding protein [Candidatus Polarisedimenticolaceae bacterium]